MFRGHWLLWALVINYYNWVLETADMYSFRGLEAKSQKSRGWHALLEVPGEALSCLFQFLEALVALG